MSSAANLLTAIFLSCTKNTELTTRQFPRTFGSPLTQNFPFGEQRRPLQSGSMQIAKEPKTGTMKAANSWITYRTRFLVKAKQLTGSFSFTDALGRQHSGRKGDYLVEFSDGVLRIASRQIFEDIYVPIIADPSQTRTNSGVSAGLSRIPPARNQPFPSARTAISG